MRKKENAPKSNKAGAQLSEFILLLKDAIKTNLKLLSFLKKNKKDIFLFEDCYFTVDASVKDLNEIYKDTCAKTSGTKTR